MIIKIDEFIKNTIQEWIIIRPLKLSTNWKQWITTNHRYIPMVDIIIMVPIKIIIKEGINWNLQQHHTLIASSVTEKWESTKKLGKQQDGSKIFHTPKMIWRQKVKNIYMDTRLEMDPNKKPLGYLEGWKYRTKQHYPPQNMLLNKKNKIKTRFYNNIKLRYCLNQLRTLNINIVQ